MEQKAGWRALVGVWRARREAEDQTTNLPLPESGCGPAESEAGETTK